MTKEEQMAMDLLIHTLVDKIDQLGQGRELMKHLGEEGTKTLMARYRQHEKTTGQR